MNILAVGLEEGKIIVKCQEGLEPDLGTMYT